MSHIVLPRRRTAAQPAESELFRVPEGFQHVQPDLRRECCYEYLDNTADIQIHSWGASFAEALEMVALGMFGYITDAQTIEYDGRPISISAEGSDLKSLLYQFLSNYLNAFCCHGRLCGDVRVVECDQRALRVRSLGFGESFQQAKHPQGTEVKAVTYSNMQITLRKGRTDIYVIVDI